MRSRIYQDQLKPYFAGGAYNHIQYCKKFFREDRRMTINKMLDRKMEKEVSQSFWQAYLVIDPLKSKFYPWWQFILLLTIQSQFLLFPFTVCFQIDVSLKTTADIELCIDILFMLNIIINFLTSLVSDDRVDRDLKRIAMVYVKDNFFFDLLSTLPGFFLSLNSNLYFFKAIRLKKFGQMNTMMKKIIG